MSSEMIPENIGQAATELKRRVVRWIFLGSLPIFLAIGISLTKELTRISNLSLQERTVEWMRGHHMGAVINTFENSYYKSHQPKAGGAPVLSQVGVTAIDKTPTVSDVPTIDPNVPVAIVPLSNTPFSGEGMWKPFSESVRGQYPIQATFLRADAVHTSVIDAIVHINQQLVTTYLMPGRTIPGNTNQHLTIPLKDRATFLGGFNSGFRIADSHGGFYMNGKTAKHLVTGLASFVVHTDGTINVAQWGRDETMSPNVIAVRQNLALLVDNSQVVSGVDDVKNRRWGHTVSNQLFVWRSGLGVDAQGNLLYAAGDGLSVRTLAELLKRAGAVRAMELDINHPYVSYNMFQHRVDGTIDPTLSTKLLPKMKKPATRYLSADDRDWVALLARP